jgi:hypothetical protein
MFILYYIKILSGSRNFYRLRMTSLTYVNEYFHDFMFVNRAPPPVNLVLQHCCKALQSLYCTIRRLFVLFVAYSRTIRTIRTIRRLFADYSYYSSTIRAIRTIRFTILVLSIAFLICAIFEDAIFRWYFGLDLWWWTQCAGFILI